MTGLEPAASGLWRATSDSHVVWRQVYTRNIGNRHHADRARHQPPSDWRKPSIVLAILRAGDRGRTGDVQLGKLIDEGPEDYDPWA